MPAETLSRSQMEAVAEHVEHSGGGFLMTGGDRSFGPGGYANTPIEEILPVDLRVRRRENRPSLALVLVVDKSGSMAGQEESRSKIDVAKEATLSLLDVLAPSDFIGVIAFDKEAQTISGLRQVAEKTAVRGAIESLEAGGGTTIYPALDLAHQWLRELTASGVERKHVLLLSDGRTEAANFEELVGKLVNSGEVLSVVGIGSDVDREFLSELAALGLGRAYFSEAISELPSILAREGALIAGEWLVERRFQPQATGLHEILKGIDTSTVPEMNGYVASVAKPRSRVLLVSDSRDPILACSRFGLGKTLAFTSDLSSPWAGDWMAWEKMGRLWSQMARWASRRVEAEKLHASIQVVDDTATVVVDAFEANGRFINGLDVRAVIRTPDSSIQEIRLAQESAGRYEGDFTVEGKGTYLLSVTGSGGRDEMEETVHFGAHFGTFPEHRDLAPDIRLLKDVSGRAGGSILSVHENPFSSETQGKSYEEAWRLVTIVVLFLFLLDVAVRRRVTLTHLFTSVIRRRTGHPARKTFSETS